MIWMRLRLLVGALSFFCLVVALPSELQADSTVVVPFGSQHRFAFYPYSGGEIWDNVPPEVLSASYDDSSWAVGDAPFGVSDPSCSVDVSTAWTLSDEILVLRVRFYLPGGPHYYAYADLRHHDNFQMVIDGDPWGSSYIWPKCPYMEQTWDTFFNVSVGGEHVVVLLALTTPPAANDYFHQYFDVQVRADLPTAAHRATWGGVKALYRQD